MKLPMSYNAPSLPASVTQRGPGRPLSGDERRGFEGQRLREPRTAAGDICVGHWEGRGLEMWQKQSPCLAPRVPNAASAGPL